MLDIKSFIYYEHQEKEYVMEHFHNCYELVFYLEGKGDLTVSNESYSYAGPTITIVKPGIKHDETCLSFSRLFIVLFEASEEYHFKPFTILKLTEEMNEVFLPLFNKIKDEEDKRLPFYKNLMNACFSEVITYALRYSANSKRNDCNKDLVNRIKTYIKENYKLKIDFEKIAASYGYSYNRLRHIFKEETGVSINQYLLNCRLYAAKQMLINTDLSIKEIAIEAGFSDNVYFNNFFSKRMNIPPQKFRESKEHQIDIGVFKI